MEPIREPIAIIGSGCRFPGGANTVSKLWDLLEQPQDVSEPISSERFNIDRFYHPTGSHHGTTNVKNAYFIAGNARKFDAPFFSVLPSEADSMDPQHRMLLEVCYEASESAGVTLSDLSGSDTAVFIGLMSYDYSGLVSRDANFIPTYLSSGTANSNAAARVSYHFDCHGPSMMIDTACSSSLVAIHQAVQVLRDGVSRIAIAAGTNLILDSGNFIAGSKMNMLSPTGHSRMWDAKADGYARGEGVGAVILKTLRSAIEDGDDIECIIRETGINQDGKTKGITMPSASAQSALIQSTYAKAGLDLTKKNGRCQYFEAHGTGTPAGDPQEAEALSKAFFGHGNDGPDNILYVGSVKTVVGHTEGTAGIAGILKASVALQKAVIPPNLLFDQLNPNVAPFYTNMRIPKEAQQWPVIPDGTPRRASVNSFGFGGTNAHAILESYQSSIVGSNIPRTDESIPLIPFLFSATSDKSLEEVMKGYLSFLQSNPLVDLHQLAYTLSCRRSALAVKTSFSAFTAAELCTSIETRLDPSSGESKLAGVRSVPCSAILGVFTGQGAQWAGMGVELINSHPQAQKIIKKLDASLATLPLPDRPTWNILTELAADKKSTRLGEAIFSQTLCTAVQIVLADLLESAGVVFKAVVGHSSGEIAAAYVAGFISAHDAIRIAYYRGFYAKLASGPGGIRGAMIAVGTSPDDGDAMCELEDFNGRINVAACNSPESITISGDSDAIDEVRIIFEEEGKFVRPLQVSTAYHSHHMLLCHDAYVKAIQDCKLQCLKPKEGGPTWYSSVEAGARIEGGSSLEATYWAENMTSPVLFTHAVECALEECEIFDLALEIGPHPALKGPVAQTLLLSGVDNLPYIGVLNRGKNDLRSFLDALGFIWCHAGALAIDFLKFQKAHHSESGHSTPMKGLPTYAWNHERDYWCESRKGRQYRTQPAAIHDFLGRRTDDGMEDQWRWENVLSVRENPWLSGHALQGQTVLPATGYIALAMEAANQVANGVSVRLIDLTNVLIIKAIAIEDDTGIEVAVTMSEITVSDHSSITAKYACYSSVSKSSGSMAVCATADVEIFLGEGVIDVLPSPPKTDLAMAGVDLDIFYECLSELGYGYSGDFRAMSNLTRRLGTSNGTILPPADLSSASKLPFYPSMLDTAIQGMFAAYSAPTDGRLWTLYAPTGMHRVSLVPALCAENKPKSASFVGTMSEETPNNITGDICVYSIDGNQTIIEIEGLVCRPFSPATQSDDCHLFADTVWNVATPNGDILLGNNRASAGQLKKAYDCERVALHYMKSLNDCIPEIERAAIGLPIHHEALFNNITRVVELVSNGKHDYAQKEWLSDTREEIHSVMDSYGPDADFNIMRAVGENLPAVIRGETSMLEHMVKDERLDNYYKDALGFEHAYDVTTDMFTQFVHRYPHMNIIEVGSGTGGATIPILNRIGAAFSSYTFTDVGVGFLAKAQDVFKDKDYASKMVFKTLDIEKDPTTQGFAAHSYDIVLAANVLHATRRLEETLTNARKLLRPGGYLILLEIVDNRPLRVGLVFGGLPGWWIGGDDGRQYAPTIELTKWNMILKQTGFSGIDTFTPLDDPLVYLASVFVSQAVDETMEVIRRPLLSPLDWVPILNLLVIGGDTMETARLIEDAGQLLRPRSRHIITAVTLKDLKDVEVPPMCTVLSLVEIDRPIFKAMTEEDWQALKNVFTAARNVLWVTRGYRREDPYAAMTVGFMRCITYELPQLRSQMLDIDQSKIVNGTLLAEMILRLHIAEDFGISDQRGSVMWTSETEIVIKNESLFIPRMMPQIEQNKRYNSSRRTINKASDLRKTVIVLEWLNEGYVLREGAVLSHHNSDTHTLIDVHSSLLCALRLPGARLFLSIGFDKQTGTQALSASSINASTVSVPKQWSIPIDVPSSSHATYLAAILAYILDQFLCASVPAGGVILVHEPSPVLAGILLLTSKCRVVFSTGEEVANDKWLKIHPQSSSRSIKAIIPGHVALFLDLSQKESSAALSSRISATLPALCQRAHHSMILSKESFVLADDRDFDGTISNTLHHANIFACSLLSSKTTDVLPLPGFGLAELSPPPHHDPFSVIAWHSETKVTTLIEPVDSKKNIFQSNKTFWLVGLAGDLGQSLCDWMAEHGARYIVLMSRTRRVEDNWIRKHKANGVSIIFMTGDVTNRNDVRKVYDEISATLPEIVGVANGALILKDEAFEKMRLEDFQKVVKPKVDGTMFLSELFERNTLDFFIAFSSIVATLGNSGQSAYSAANSFTKALINQRRERGLAGSVIDLSRIAGVGYVDRELKLTKISEKQVRRLMKVSMPMSEPDLHQVFAEAVISGRPGSGLKSEIISGIRTLTVEEDSTVYWAALVKFSHFVRFQENGSDDTGNKAAKIPVKTMLQAAKSPEQAIIILRNAFIANLKSSLNLSSDDSVDYNTPLIELGLDSLVAVGIRTWFLQEIKVDMPVMKILGGASALELVLLAAEKIPQGILPNFGDVPNGELGPSLDVAPPSATIPRPNKPAHLPKPVETQHPSKSVPRPPTMTSGSSTSTLTRSSKSSPPPSSISTAGGNLQTPPSESETRLSGLKLVLSQADISIPDPGNSREEPMSYSQSGFWFLGQYLEDPTAFNITIWIRVKGSIDASRLGRAVDLVAQSTESLRTVFTTSEGKPCQKIMERSEFHLDQQPVESQAEFMNIFKALERHIYDIEHGDTVKLLLCKESDDLFYIALGFHHILMDAISTDIIIGNVQHAYEAETFVNTQLQYPAWAKNQRAYVESQDSSKDRAYWSQEFATIPPVLPLFPMSQQSSRKALKSYHMIRANISLGADTTARIKERCRSQSVSPAYFHLTVWKTLLFRFLAVNDICIGITDMNRTSAEDAGVVGNLMNILPVRFKFNPTQNFIHATKETQKRVTVAISHAKLPFDVILAGLKAVRNPTYSPIFQASFDYRETAKKTFLDHEMYSPPENLSLNSNGYDGSLGVLETVGEGCTVHIGVQSALYSQQDAEVILRTYQHLLETFAERPASRVDRPLLFSKTDVARGIVLGLGASLNSVWPETLLHRIDDIIGTSGASIAIKDGSGNSLTFSQMDLRVQSIAGSLSRIENVEDSYIGVFQQPSVDWVCSMLAIMRVGAVCVPLDCQNGLPRLARIVKDSRLVAVLVDSTTIDDVKSLGLEKSPAINVTGLKISSTLRFPLKSRPESLAITLFTGGTTGAPKGVILKHSSIRNLIEGLTKKYGIGKENVLQQTAFSFDMALDQMFIALCNGGTLFVVDAARRGDSQALMKIIASEGITYTKATPPEYISWIRHGADQISSSCTWKHAFAGGDRMNHSLGGDFRSLSLLNLRLYNSYGPTETTLSAIKTQIHYQDNTSSDENIPLGTPMPGYSIYILDTHMNPVSPGVPGEIVIGGAGVSPGYLNNESLTADKFLDNPWMSPEFAKNGWTKMYRTGDRGRMTPEGQVLFHGRIEGDLQIKLRGFRIELEDIESSILQASEGNFTEVVCSIRGDPEFLVAHAIFAKNFESKGEDGGQFIKNLLAHLPLPSYMVPAAIIPLDAMPLTVHLKRDRAAVAALPISQQAPVEEETSDLDPSELELMAIWMEVLPQEMFNGISSRNSNFFRCGGSSLLMVELQSRIRTTLGVSLSLQELFKTSDLGDMAKSIQERMTPTV